MSTVLPVIEPALKPQPHTDVDFDEKLAAHGLELRAVTVDTLQVNVGKLCNQACKHCHVDASPKRTEIMMRETAEAVIDAVHRFRIPTLDITGGAPELNPSFRYLVTEGHTAGAHVIVRHNLTVMFESGQADLPEFFRNHAVEVVSSLPYFLEEQTDAHYRTAIIWGALTTLAGALVLGLFAARMMKFFTSGIVSAKPTPAFTLAVICGTVGWVIIATVTHLPVSTTHAIAGSLLGAGWLFAPTAIAWSKLAPRLAVPLLLSIASLTRFLLVLIKCSPGATRRRSIAFALEQSSLMPACCK
ncbi:MAG TPA: inorganic phosphate transporter [Pyrinomonadaceae bacterium]|nr:inorganic phosphate transporter [Pyrinomonadaceae bacterium]